MRRIVLVLLCLLVFGVAEAQQADLRPEWVDGYFRELDASYIEVVSATGTDLSLARDKAARLIVERRNMASGSQYTVRVTGKTVSVSGSDNLTVKARVVDEYAEHRGDGDWVVYLLVQTAKNPLYNYEAVSVTDRYPMSYKTFVPGMTQIDKGQTVKGLVMIGAEVAMIGGVVAFEGTRNSYSSKIASTHSASQRTAYTNRANTCSTMRNLCIAGAVAVYAWNIVDALVSKGPRRILVSDASVTARPYVSPLAAGLALNINF